MQSAEMLVLSLSRLRLLETRALIYKTSRSSLVEDLVPTFRLIVPRVGVHHEAVRFLFFGT